jgi:hypothetical protein
MAYLPSSLQWIKITKTYTDFSTAGLTNTISIYTLPAKGVVHGVQLNPSVAFSGGLIATYTISVGITGNNVKYQAATNVFTGASFTVNTSALMFVENIGGTTTINATAISTVGNLNAATAGSVDIWLLVSTLP